MTYSLKSTPNDRFFEKLFIAILFIVISYNCRRAQELNILLTSLRRIFQKDLGMTPYKVQLPRFFFASLDGPTRKCTMMSLSPKKNTSFQMKLIFILVGTLICQIAVFGALVSPSFNLKSTPNDRLFMAVLIYSQCFCQKSAESKSPKKYFLYFVLISGLGLEPWLYV